MDAAAMSGNGMRFILVLAAFACSQAATAAGSAEKGKVAYVKHGCWQCHGFMGQGGVTGPKLAPNPMALDALSAFVRNTRGAMPPYQSAILSEADLADIHAYLQSLPKAPDYKSIPLLNP
jgi:ubiquinol-cytochrome c reductase cytochrome c subunit